MVNGDTVVALSTPYGYGGIGVVRVTGPGSLKVFGGLSCMSKRKLHAIKPRFAYKKIISTMVNSLVNVFNTKG